jgi:hypothetical protein
MLIKHTKNSYIFNVRQGIIEKVERDRVKILKFE